MLIDVFEQVCDVVDPGAENPRKRATRAIQRLRDQRMLARVDGAGIVRAGEYALTRLAAAVVEYFFADEALTRESLTLLTGTLRAQLAEVLAAVKKADRRAKGAPFSGEAKAASPPQRGALAKSPWLEALGSKRARSACFGARVEPWPRSRPL